MIQKTMVPRVDGSRSWLLRVWRNVSLRIGLLPVALAAYFAPIIFLIYLGLGLLDFARNKRRTLAALDRYFAIRGFSTWLFSPFNLLMDLLTLPYRNKGIYQLADLPAPCQDEIKTILEVARERNLLGKLEAKMDGKTRSMIFFKWYGKNLQTSVDIPEYHQQYRYIKSIGVSIFCARESIAKHYGPLRATLRVLYNINQIESENAYIKVGGHINRWRDSKLFIFDDTLEHETHNQTDEMRYCMFVDIVRPSLFPRLMGAVVTAIGTIGARFNFVFYKQHWVFIK